MTMPPGGLPTIDASDASAKLEAADEAGPLLVDVREPDEYKTVRANGAVLVPMSEFAARARGAAEGPPDLRDLRQRQPLGGRDGVPAPERLDGRRERRRRHGRVGAPRVAGQPRLIDRSRRGRSRWAIRPSAPGDAARRFLSHSRPAATFSLWANAQPTSSRITKSMTPTVFAAR